MLIQLVGHTRCLDNDSTLSSDNGVTGHLSKITSSNFKKLIQTVLIQLENRTLHSEYGDNLSSDNGGTGHVYKVTSVS